MKYEYAAKLLRVVDGDTVDLEVDLGFHIFHTMRVRLAGVNTPETYGVKRESDEYKAGLIAKNRVIELLTGKDLILRTDKDRTGKYGRYLATIFVGDLNLNETLLSEGLGEKY